MQNSELVIAELRNEFECWFCILNSNLCIQSVLTPMPFFSRWRAYSIE
jgi:hypothetical protein